MASRLDWKNNFSGPYFFNLKMSGLVDIIFCEVPDIGKILGLSFKKKKKKSSSTSFQSCPFFHLNISNMLWAEQMCSDTCTHDLIS